MNMPFEVQFPEKIQPIFGAGRYKVLYSGRNAAKSWSVARALLLKAAEHRLRILCTRETQKSIRDSVHKLLSDQIVNLGLQNNYLVYQSVISSTAGSEFVFTGLSDLTAASIKSYEGVDICWVEEAQTMSDNSWNVLTKTIRKDGSEIWITFNPELDTDPTWVRFVQNRYPDSIVIPLSYRDNPWHSTTMEQERQQDAKLLTTVDYQNIWDGTCRPTVRGAIYADEVALMVKEQRIGHFPYDPFLPVFAIFDLGWNDSMFIIIAQRHQSALRVIDCIEDDHKTLDHYSAELRKMQYPIVQLFLPHDGEHADYRTGQSAKDIFEGLKWRVEVLPLSPVEDGIKAGRMAFRGLYIDVRCIPLIECLKRYRRAIPNSTGEAGAPLHDNWSHGADCYRYTCLAAPQMANFGSGEGLKLQPLKYGWKP